MVQRLDTSNYLRGVSLYCDGKKIGKLGFAERLEFEIPKDAKSVYAKIDWCQTATLNLNSSELEETFLIECNGSIKHLIMNQSDAVTMKRVDAMDLPSFYELSDYKKNFRKTASTAILVLSLFAFFFAYSLYVAIGESNSLWYILAAIAGYQMYKITLGMRSRVNGVDPHC